MTTTIARALLWLGASAVFASVMAPMFLEAIAS
ncbi:hypothetical protein GGR01_002256 [Acetobacter oeni]|nr:hypothetical protein [Acetobacter oeni]